MIMLGAMLGPNVFERRDHTATGGARLYEYITLMNVNPIPPNP
jgi:hypothetical protein